MKLELDSLTEEIISVELSEAGISTEIIDKVIDSIKYNMKETNYLHNSVADSNYYAAEKRKEDERISNLRKEIEESEKEWRKKYEDMEHDLRYRIRRQQEEIERLNNL